MDNRNEWRSWWSVCVTSSFVTSSSSLWHVGIVSAGWQQFQQTHNANDGSTTRCHGAWLDITNAVNVTGAPSTC